MIVQSIQFPVNPSCLPMNLFPCAPSAAAWGCGCKAPSSFAAAARDTVVILLALAATLEVVCDENVGVNGAAQIGLSGGAHSGIEFPVSYTVIGPRALSLTYPSAVAAGDVVFFPFHDPAVRTSGGGFMATVAAGTVVS